MLVSPGSISRASMTGLSDSRSSSRARETRPSSGESASSPPRRSQSSWARSRKASASAWTLSGSITTTGSAAEVLPGRHGGAAAPAAAARRGSRERSPAPGSPGTGPARARARIAPRPRVRSDATDGAGGEDVGEGKGRELVERGHGALGLRVEGAEALHGVAQELEADRGLAVGGEDVEDARRGGPSGRGRSPDPPARSRLRRAPPEGSPASSRRPPARRARASRAGGGSGWGGRGRPARPRRPGGRPGGPRAGWPRAGARRRRGAAGRGRAADPAPGRQARRPEAGGRGERAQVLGEVVDVLLSWHHHERRRVRQEQRHEAAHGSDESGERHPARAAERLAGFAEPGRRAQALEGALRRAGSSPFILAGSARRSRSSSGPAASRPAPRAPRRLPRLRGRRSGREASPPPSRARRAGERG